jgi:hypothetical protein
MLLPHAFSELVLLCFASTMTTPTLRTLLLLLPGWILSPRRTITAMLQAAGLAGKLHHARFHRLFADARWSLDQAGLALFGLALAFLPEHSTIFLAADDTLARKRGLKIFGVGMHHDPLLSSRGKAIVNWGHSWVVLGVLVAFPFRPGVHFCLPILFRLYRGQQTVAREGEAAGPYRTRPELLVEMLALLCPARPERHFHLLVDGGYSGQSVARHLPGNCELTGRCLLEAALYGLVPERRPGQKGRSRKRGARLATPRQMLAEQAGDKLTLRLYGKQAKVRVVWVVALWYAVLPSRPVRVLAVSPWRGGHKEEVFFSTCLEALPAQILIWYARRWSVEVAFHEAKGALGFEEPQGWSRGAVERTAPLALLLYSLVVLWFAQEGWPQVQFPCRPWYRQKRAVSFADMLRTLRRLGLAQRFMRPRLPHHLAQNSVEELISLAAWAI